ncbi:hypothetical protein MHZ92_05455 [Sporosarcina sp. ACRSL]|uniref:hypothetical protein n=1 Tax=Sporosarcina sp. ACRSL TaxID=2918215 RepID=UPI001EF56746|nr:hypothetical protein [Sporosarcina sp. ACRSL]MCG7343567.1 hypothetical protein [Sporosarcina sp. ACRSL]
MERVDGLERIMKIFNLTTTDILNKSWELMYAPKSVDPETLLSFADDLINEITRLLDSGYFTGEREKELIEARRVAIMAKRSLKQRV